MPRFRWNDPKIWRFLATRLVFSVLVLIGAATVVFLLFALIPADATADVLGLQTDPDARAQLSHNLGLDRPLAARYLLYLRNLATGNLGHSLAGLGEVGPLLLTRLRTSLPLVLAAAVAALVCGLLLAFAVTWLNRPRIYRLADAVSLAFASLPVFVTALALTIAFGGGSTFPILYDESWRSAILPVAALATAPTFWVARLVSTDVRRILSRKFILFRRTLGFSSTALLITAFRHVSLLVALGTNLTLALIVGTFFVEYAFNWPGLGQLLVYSLLRRDVPVVQGVVLCFAAMILVADSLVETARRFREHAK